MGGLFSGTTKTFDCIVCDLQKVEKVKKLPKFTNEIHPKQCSWICKACNAKDEQSEFTRTVLAKYHGGDKELPLWLQTSEDRKQIKSLEARYSGLGGVKIFMDDREKGILRDPITGEVMTEVQVELLEHLKCTIVPYLNERCDAREAIKAYWEIFKDADLSHIKSGFRGIGYYPRVNKVERQTCLSMKELQICLNKKVSTTIFTEPAGSVDDAKQEIINYLDSQELRSYEGSWSYDLLINIVRRMRLHVEVEEDLSKAPKAPKPGSDREIYTNEAAKETGYSKEKHPRGSSIFRQYHILTNKYYDAITRFAKYHEVILSHKALLYLRQTSLFVDTNLPKIEAVDGDETGLNVTRRLAECGFGVPTSHWVIFAAIVLLAFVFGIVFLLNQTRQQQEEIESRDSIFSVSHMV